MNRGTFVAGLILLAACNQGGSDIVQQGAARMPALTFAKPDLSTPDLAVKSWWAMQDSSEAWATRSRPAAQAFPWAKAEREATLAITTGMAYQDAIDDKAPPLETYSREVIKVDNESDTRAVVTARIRNTTPIPPGAEVGEYTAKARREGEVFRYIMERDQAGWKVSQIMSQSYAGSGWTPRYEPGRVSASTYVRP